MSNFDQNKVDKWIHLITAFIALVLVIFLVLYMYYFSGGVSGLHSNWGQFGDFFGGLVGSLISLLAVILLFFTYRLQREELSKSAEALNNQNEQIKIQQFENIVFKLIDRKESVLNGMDLQGAEGINAVTKFIKQKKHMVENRGYNDMRAIEELWSEHESVIWPYFNSVITTIGFIKSYEVSSIVMYRLSEIYFSYFTTQEIQLLDDINKIHFEPEYIDAIKYFRDYNSKHLENS